jgi:hypothetical protein
MNDEILRRDENRITVMAGITDDADKDIKMFRVDPTSKRLLISADPTSFDARFLKLDQTTPQTIINGTPIFSTNIQTPKVIGGTAITDILKLQGTTGNGTATSPAIQFLVGNNGGTIAGTILNNGNVGIGTTAPGALLHLLKAASGVVGPTITLENNSSTLNDAANIDIILNGGSLVSSRIGSVRTNSPISTDSDLYFSTRGNAATAERMRITSTGNVGIGTTSPQTKLALSSGSAISFEASAGVTDIALTHSADTLTLSGGNLALGANNLTLTGSIGATGARTTKLWATDVELTNLPTINGGTLAASLTSLNSTTSATQLPWTGLKAGTDGEIPTFDASGNPAFVATGDSGQVLTSNGAGAAPTFQAAAAGGGADTALSNLVENPVIMVATVSLSAANIAAMYATPVECIANPGVGKVIVVDQITMSYTRVSASYTGGGSTRLAYSSTPTLEAGTISSDVIKGGSSAIDIRDVVASVVGISNNSIVVTNSTAAFATGSGTIKLFIRYRIITL